MFWYALKRIVRASLYPIDLHFLDMLKSNGHTPLLCVICKIFFSVSNGTKFILIVDRFTSVGLKVLAPRTSCERAEPDSPLW